MHTGKIGRELTTEDGYRLARLVAVNLMATIKGSAQRSQAHAVVLVVAAALDARACVLTTRPCKTPCFIRRGDSLRRAGALVFV